MIYFKDKDKFKKLNIKDKPKISYKRKTKYQKFIEDYELNGLYWKPKNKIYCSLESEN